jgi:hypothetical protein
MLCQAGADQDVGKDAGCNISARQIAELIKSSDSSDEDAEDHPSTI